MTHQPKFWILGAVLVAVILGSPALTLGAWAQSHYKSLHTFKGSSDGSLPYGGLIMDRAGNLYGTTSVGGAAKLGTVFGLTPGANGKWTEQVLYSFTGGNDGAGPRASLIFDQAGNLYGTTFGGGAGGTVFELTPGANGKWTEKVLHSFGAGNDGANPVASLIFDQVGDLYGTTLYGGTGPGCDNGCGTVFELTPNSDGTWTENVLYSFCSQKECSDGWAPLGSVIFDQAGNLYGTTQVGGIKCAINGGCGVAFQLTPNATGTWTEKVLHRFCSRSGCLDGSTPDAGLIIDQFGNLYGTTQYSDVHSNGVVFQLTPQADGSWKEEVLHRFARSGDGIFPVAPLAFDQAGNLYGTTGAGGSDPACGSIGCGTVFKLTPSSGGGWHEAVLHSFQDHPGAVPQVGVIFDSLGNLYGTTHGDNQTTFGSVFEITP
jgi:uncharacterized repeat protein (TIGR03803 family)